MEAQKAKEWADRIAPMIEEIERTDDVAAKLIHLFSNTIMLGGQIERERQRKEEEHDKN